VLSEAEAPVLSEAEAPVLSEAEAPVLSEAEAPVLSEAEAPPPVVSAQVCDPPAAMAVTPLARPLTFTGVG
jgi:hypothetical protein